MDIKNSPAYLQHLSFVQNIIARMSNLGSNCKVWVITLVAAFIIIGSQNKDSVHILHFIPICIIVIFTFIDISFLVIERYYIKHYNQMVTHVSSEDFDEKSILIIPKPPKGKERVLLYIKALFSINSMFYLAILLLTLFSLCLEGIYMELIQANNLKSRFMRKGVILEYEKLNDILRAKSNDKYDIFLSHSFKDQSVIMGLKYSLEDLGYSVYVDWLDDPNLNRSHVNSSTAATIKRRMNASNSLIYARSINSLESLWMPWEVGYMDGIGKKIAILPIANSPQDNYDGTEYLGIYPSIQDISGTWFVVDGVWKTLKSWI